ncbi:MAG: type VI secretion system contractile sheath small subunit [Chitinispirillaceae bacterium]|nr:type VI secretion system contractile sheath small subunit [Chitinispirillaceae bacterium]
MSGSFQNEIPAARINLKLDVGKGDAKKKMELPLKLLVLGDFSLKNKGERLAEREKISINKNNFEQVMESMNLNLKYNVENKITGKGDLHVDLNIKNMDSFKPENVAKSVPELSRLLAARNLLKDLKSNLLDNREFRQRLEEILKNPDAVKSLQEELSKLLPPEGSQEETKEEPKESK